jgi:N-acetylglucosaminylphosphatidylinositol deacetylase
MEGLTVILVSILGFCVMFHFLAHYFKPYSRLKMLKDAKRILIITSHPDDETMFFGPTILSLCRGKSNFKSANLFLLCMSTGDHKKMGSKRKHELYNACKILGIPEENITILSYTRLRDDPGIRWREEVVSEGVLQTAYANEIDTILTFDRYGISGHKNHSSIYSAMAYLVMENRLANGTKVFTLRSVNVLRKYSSLLDVPMSFLLASVVYTASIKDWCILHKAMAAHKSQNVWFRKLYMLFSRYILINTFDQIKMVGHHGGSLASSGHVNQMNFRRQTSIEKRKTN